MITFDLLKNHQQHIPELAQLMFEEWGKFYPNSSLEIMSNWLRKTARQNGLPIAMLALDEQTLQAAPWSKITNFIVKELCPGLVGYW